MLKRAALIPLLLTALGMQAQSKGVVVEVVATASEYVPRSVTFSHPGHSYTDCSGSTSYFGQFNPYTNSVSGQANTNTSCSSTTYPPTESTFTVYRKVNYTIVKSDRALFLLSCTQKWRWSKCPSLGIGASYDLSIEKSSVFLADATGVKPIKLDYLRSVALPAAVDHSPPQPPAQTLGPPAGATVHITSMPSGAEIFIDGQFFGNTPSDVLLPAGEHGVKVTAGGKEWSRSLQITSGEITLHADIPGDGH